METLGYTHHIIMDDYNTDLLASCSPRSRKHLQVMESSSLHVLPLSATHHNFNIPTHTILTSSLFFVRSHGQHKAPGLSQYVLIYLSYALKLTKPHAQFRHIRCFGGMN